MMLAHWNFRHSFSRCEKRKSEERKREKVSRSFFSESVYWGLWIWNPTNGKVSWIIHTVHLVSNNNSNRASSLLTATNMRIATSPSFSRWLLRVSNVYPFTELRVTRHGFTCKYVIVEEKEPHLTNYEKYFCQTTNTMALSLLEALLYQGGCKPLPPDMADIMDYMIVSGFQKNPK